MKSCETLCTKPLALSTAIRMEKKEWFQWKKQTLVASSNEEERTRSILMIFFNHFLRAHGENIFAGK